MIDLGADVAYDDGLKAMREAMARIDDEGPLGGPALVLIEHTPTITITRRGGVAAFVSPREVIEHDGIAVVEADRGGDVTYHGPGQLTGYPILRLGDTSLGCDVVGFVRAMEAGIVDACRALGVTSAHHVEGKDEGGHVLTGVWADEPRRETGFAVCRRGELLRGGRGNLPARSDEPVVADETLGCHFHVVEHRQAKVCAIGVGLGGGVTRHGFALNVTTHLERYTRHIVPCGLQARGVTSLERLLPRTPPMDAVKARVVEAVGARLGPLHRPRTSSSSSSSSS